jgi:hypothetical protein
MHNYDQLVKIAENLGCLEDMIEQRYAHLKRGINHVKSSGEVLQTAVVCRVNKIKYPDEVLAKVLQLRNVEYRPVEEWEQYKSNQQRNYERYLFVSNKYIPSVERGSALRKVTDKNAYTE